MSLMPIKAKTSTENSKNLCQRQMLLPSTMEKQPPCNDLKNAVIWLIACSVYFVFHLCVLISSYFFFCCSDLVYMPWNMHLISVQRGMHANNPQVGTVYSEVVGV